MNRFTHSILGLAIGLGSQAQLVVNEACSKNLSVPTDPLGGTTDWIELHNRGDEPIYLAGYHLSDDPQRLDAWALPAVNLEPGSYLLLSHDEVNVDGFHFPFKLGSGGESIVLSNADLEVVDLFHLPALQPDHSAGRSTSGDVVLYDEPTPGGPNSTPAYLGYAPEPSFSTPPGFRSGPLLVGLSACADCTILLTWDGRPPTSTSAIYTGAIWLQQTTVLNAVAHRPGYLPSAGATGTYLINAHTDLPVVSLSTHPDSLFHPVTGLYELGPEADDEYPHWGANFWDERGIDVRFEYFDEAGVKCIDQEVELRIHGGRSSRNKPQRPLRLTARDRYGEDRINYGFFPEKPALESFKRIILRNSGSDWNHAHYRDGFFHQAALHAGLDIDVLGFKPCVVYLNGSYWGIHNIRERVDADYLALNHGVDPEAVLLMDEENHVIQGDSLHFDSLQHFIRTHDMADDLQFARVDSLIDLKSFMDYFALEMFAGNSDWPSNNLKYWKPSTHTGKWRYLMYDMDATMAAAPWIPNDFDMFHWVLVHRDGFIHAEIFASLMERPEFRRNYLNRLADLMNTCLAPPNLLADNALIREGIRAEMPHHMQRWWGDLGHWEQETEQILPLWMQERADHMREDVLLWYELPNAATLRFEMFPHDAGTLQVNTLTPALPFDGTYFNGNDIDVSVEPDPGFTFSHWSYSAEPDGAMREPHLRRSFATNGTLVAHFAKQGSAFYVFPNPTTASCEISFETAIAGEVEVSLWDTHGRLVGGRSFLSTAGVNRIPMDLSTVAPGLLEIRVDQNGAVSATRVIKQ